MSIKDIPQKIKSCYQYYFPPAMNLLRSSLDLKKDIFIVLVIILVGLAGFGLGRLSAMEKGRATVQMVAPDFIVASSTNANNNPQGMLVASKSGTKYHFPWCAGALQIAEKNKVWFNSYELAQKAGYSPASNCPNLK